MAWTGRRYAGRGGLLSGAGAADDGSAWARDLTLIVGIVLALIAIGAYLSWTAAPATACTPGSTPPAPPSTPIAPPRLGHPGAGHFRRPGPGRLDRPVRGGHAARQAEEDHREVAESELSAALRAVFGEPAQVDAVKEIPGGVEAATELAAAVRRVPMARRFHNDAVRAARALRRHCTVRLLRLAGHAPFPLAFEMDDAPPVALADRPGT
ncbi:membrane protein [Streptomyces badius]